ncbi:ATP-binding protein [Nocardia jiangsuensis]|uniref:ATP-binding protein n=1 Tax=Nocardia jiangsuensis TaxID=1691563 RepID=A0ABV8E0S3_9NOCA
MSGSTVAMEIEARPEQLGILRSMTRSLGLGLGLAIDAAADLELVAHEIATALIPVAGPGASLRFEYRVEAIEIEVLISSHTAVPPVLNGLGWHIVRTLVTDFALGCGSYDPAGAGHPVTVGFSWPHPLG